jgi:hypothetical protein
VRQAGPARLLPAHGTEVVEVERALRRHAEHKARREDQVVAALAAGRTAVPEITESIYHGLAPALVKAARYFGQTNATARVLTLTELEKSQLPAIVSISTLPTVHHATLLIKLDAEHAAFIDPAYGPWEVSRARFQEIWYGKTVLLK